MADLTLDQETLLSASIVYYNFVDTAMVFVMVAFEETPVLADIPTQTLT